MFWNITLKVWEGLDPRKSPNASEVGSSSLVTVVTLGVARLGVVGEGSSSSEVSLVGLRVSDGMVTSGGKGGGAVDSLGKKKFCQSKVHERSGSMGSSREKKDVSSESGSSEFQRLGASSALSGLVSTGVVERWGQCGSSMSESVS